MELSELLTQLKAAHPNARLSIERFGQRQGIVSTPLVWVEAEHLTAVSGWLSSHGWGCLENVSVMQLEDCFFVSYFLRPAVESPALLVLRVSAEKNIDLPSVAGVWAIAAPYEREATELFGAHFRGLPVAAPGTGLLPEGFRGAPLRKDYVFPREVSGISHSREGGGA